MSDTPLDPRVDRVFERLCALPAPGLFTSPEVLALLDLLSKPEHLTALHTTFVLPSRTRWLARAATSEIPLSAWLPEETARALSARLGRPVRLPHTLVSRAIANDKVREAVRATLSDAITTFVERASTALGAGPDRSSGHSPSGGGMLRGALSLGARAASKALGSLGEELQQQLMDRARDSLDGIASTAQSRIVDRIVSDDTATALGKRRQSLFDSTLKRTESAATRWLRDSPSDHLDTVLAKIISHNAARPELRAALTDELAALATDLRDDTLGSLFDRLGARPLARQWFHRVVGPAIAETFSIE